mmetsp:Transcript_34637/g.111759  ORF Transcript_34637/g.111759 Transcript_34637/m.111759 type:complete len:265 (-) Transcript_34637:525-1319(-)
MSVLNVGAERRSPATSSACSDALAASSWPAFTSALTRIACVDAVGSTPAARIASTQRSAAAASPRRAWAEQAALKATASGAMPAAVILSSQPCAAAALPARACAEMAVEYETSFGTSPRASSFWKAASASAGLPPRAQASMSVLYETKSGAAFGHSSAARASKLASVARAPSGSAALAYADRTALKHHVSGCSRAASMRLRTRAASAGRDCFAKAAMVAVKVTGDAVKPASIIVERTDSARSGCAASPRAEMTVLKDISLGGGG